MPERLLIANRGEIAVRIARAAAELGIPTIAITAQDEADPLFARVATERRALPGSGPAAYLDAEAIVGIAVEAGATLLHPGYGFLSESPEFAERCARAGITFVGPTPAALRLLGDKVQGRRLAEACGVPLARGLAAGASADDARRLLEELGQPIMIKATAGGGGRGIRVVSDPEQLDAAWASCASEAQSAFGDGTLYAEELITDARHIEVQILADSHGGIVHVGDRDCSIQRRRQKLIEIAPAPGLEPDVRGAIREAALALAGAAEYSSLGTFEFLVQRDGRFVFLEANPRVQVEHTVTEEVYGIDLVATQIQVARGASLPELGITQSRFDTARGAAIQLRVNAEVLQPDGSVVPSAGTVTILDAPGGPGIRVDTGFVAGSVVSARYDSLLLKIVACSVDGHDAARLRASGALRELDVEGVQTNAALLAVLLDQEGAVSGEISTAFVDEHTVELTARAAASPSMARSARSATAEVAAPSRAVRPDAAPPGTVPADTVPADTVPAAATSAGALVAVLVAPGDEVVRGVAVALVEAMKMEHVVVAPATGTVHSIATPLGAQVASGEAVIYIRPSESAEAMDEERDAPEPDRIRPDLEETLARIAVTLDAARGEAVERRHATGRRTIRENIADLIDVGSEIEYGQLAIAAQRARRSMEDLISTTPADGLVAMVASVNGDEFDASGRCAVLGYDYMVMAGTQGLTNHAKKDRMFDVIERSRLPVVFFAEGGGGRPGDTDHAVAAALNNHTFTAWAGLSGLVPRIAVVGGRCFAGNAAIAGSSDLIVATRAANLGMGGPVMIEGGGLGRFTPEEVGPAEEQFARGVVDLLVDDDAEAVDTARRVMGYFQGATSAWESPDTRMLRHVVPENRLRVYDVRDAIDLIFDVDSVTELRAAFATGMVTCLARVEGRPVGVIANNPTELSGAITSDGADKAARFLQLCDAFGLPVISLIDTPGIMVGPDAESTGLVRHANRLFVTSASLSVPFIGFVLRKAYGLGSQAMAGGGMNEPLYTAAWPTGEFGGMGIEGSVRLGYRKELEAIEDPLERDAYLNERVAQEYAKGRALTVATYFEVDAVIDPAETRAVITRVLRAQPDRPHWSTVPRKRTVDTW